jgi:hypothetical protein
VEKDLRRQAKALRAARTKAADKLAAAARKMLGSLGFKKADLRIEVAVAELGPHGADAVRFLFCPNAGQDLLPLDQIASSGEAARVMLALKTVLAAVDRTPALVFDEVDANVGGEIGAQVGRELAALGKGHQVFCVTHLPQVAALGHAHLVVTRRRTTSRRRSRSPRSTGKRRGPRVPSCARMLGDRASKVALSHARELALDVRARPGSPRRNGPAAGAGSCAGRSRPPTSGLGRRAEKTARILCFQPVTTTGRAAAMPRTASSAHSSAVCPPSPVELAKPAALEKCVETGPGQIATQRMPWRFASASSATLQSSRKDFVAA